jgi:tRNA(fMet)-specific endonuclease VapC
MLILVSKMAYLLDTCAISEMVSVQPNADVLSWFEHQPEETLFISVITSGEIQKGINQLATGKRKIEIEAWFYDELIPNFQGRIINIDEKLMATWAKMMAEFKPQGIVRPSFDSLIEATALHHNMILVTRNVKNFQNSKVSILNLWEK